MEFKKKTLETQIIEIFQKISPAITRLIQSETDNANIVINLGKTKSKNKTGKTCFKRVRSVFIRNCTI